MPSTSVLLLNECVFAPRRPRAPLFLIDAQRRSVSIGESGSALPGTPSQGVL